MASISKYPAKRSKKGYAWKVQYRDAAGSSRTKQGFETKDAAIAWAEKNATEVREGDWIDPAHGKTTVSELGERWLATRDDIAPSGRRTEKSHWKLYVQPVWGPRAISSIRPSEVQQWVSRTELSKKTKEPLSAAYRRHHHAVLCQILDLAVMDGMLRVNPARGISLPRKNDPVHVYLTTGQLARLAGQATSKREIIWALGTCGMRWGELAGLQAGDLHPLRGRIHLNRNAVTVGNEVVVGPLKGHERRSIAASKPVMNMLMKQAEGKAASDWLWESPKGGPMLVPSGDHFFASALRRCQAVDPDFPTLTIHGLRHVAAGILVSAGANVKVVQKQLGHRSAAMTLDTYAALFDEDLDSVAETMERSLSGVVDLQWDSGSAVSE